MSADATRGSMIRASPLHELVVAHPSAVADILVNLGGTVVAPTDVTRLLQRCADLAVELVDAADHAGVTMDFGDLCYTASCTDEITLLVDLHQYAAGDGPCLEAARTGEVVRVDVTTSRERWPGFTRDAEAVGVRSFLAAPLRANGQLVGALNLYSRSPDGLADEGSAAMALLTLLTDRASQALDTYVRLFEAEAVAEQMRAAMESRAAIEQVKGILMAARRISAEEAFGVLREESQRSNTKLRDVAERFLAETTGAGTGTAAPDVSPTGRAALAD